MANKIQLLSEQVANQIAAGEVIERPASVLKELVENSIDAGSTQIDVQLRGGGKNLIQVTDDGSGMSKDDALLCLERHATSKLKQSEDLLSINTFGFRGEAIPSIASVAKFRLRTREHDALAGHEIIIDGGKLLSVQEFGMAPGTQIEVRSLFYNLPARRKFLRTDATESSHLQHYLLLAALARPDIGFTITHDDSPASRWPKAQNLERRIATIHGENWFSSLLPVEYQEEDLKISGFIGQPGVSRANRADEIIFVNRRPVDSRTVHYGLMEGYHNALMRGRYPACVLFVEMDPASVDVNIHPAKREVRFRDDYRVRHFIVRAIQSTLRIGVTTPVNIPLDAPTHATSTPQPTPQRPASLFNIPKAPESKDDWTAATSQSHPENVVPLVEKNQTRSLPPEKVVQQLPLETEEKRPFGKQNAKTPSVRIIGCVADLYLVGESSEGMVLIDQHAAHERILFEQILQRLAKEEILSQKLLFPITLPLPPREAQFLRDQIDTLQAIGMGISDFGSGSFIIDALPPMVKTRNVEEFVRTLVVELQEAVGETRKQRRLSEETIAKTACRHAIKANDPLKPEEWERLIKDLLECDLPYTCPHGRPTMIQISKSELERKFGRAGA